MRPELNLPWFDLRWLGLRLAPVVKYFAPFLHRKCPKQGKAGRQFQGNVYLQWVNNKVSWPSYCTLDEDKAESKGRPQNVENYARWFVVFAVTHGDSTCKGHQTGGRFPSRSDLRRSLGFSGWSATGIDQ